MVRAAASSGPLDLPGLVERGWIVPGSSSTSPLVAVFAGGHASVSGIYYRRPTVGELELLERFVDGWPVQAPDCDASSFVSLDAARGAMASDISRERFDAHAARAPVGGQ